MSKLMLVLAVAATFAFTSFTSAKDKGAAGLHGKVVSVSTNKTDSKLTDITISVGHKTDAKEMVLTVDASVKITKEDGTTPGMLSDIVMGSHISVTKEGDKVTAIALMAPHKKKTT